MAPEALGLEPSPELRACAIFVSPAWSSGGLDVTSTGRAVIPISRIATTVAIACGMSYQDGRAPVPKAYATHCLLHHNMPVMAGRTHPTPSHLGMRR